MKNYEQKIANLRMRKLAQTQEKIEKEGLLDEDDYGRVVPPENLWNIIPNHPDGSFYGFDAWTDNFCSLMNIHPVWYTLMPMMLLQEDGCISCLKCGPINGIRIILMTF